MLHPCFLKMIHSFVEDNGIIKPDSDLEPLIYSQHFCQTLNGFTASENGDIIVFTKQTHIHTDTYMHICRMAHAQTHYSNDLD